MEYKKRYRPYESRFLAFSVFIERLMMKAFFFFFILLILSQFILTIDGLREFFVPIESIEGL